MAAFAADLDRLVARVEVEYFAAGAVVVAGRIRQWALQPGVQVDQGEFNKFVQAGMKTAGGLAALAGAVFLGLRGQLAIALPLGAAGLGLGRGQRRFDVLFAVKGLELDLDIVLLFFMLALFVRCRGDLRLVLVISPLVLLVISRMSAVLPVCCFHCQPVYP